MRVKEKRPAKAKRPALAASSATPAPRTLSVQYRPVGGLIPYRRNARTHSSEQIAQIAESIRQFGFTNPILIDGQNGIVAGHGRLEAAYRLGLEEVPVIELAGMTDPQKRAYVIADNKLALNAGWDDDLLAIELADLKEMGFDTGLTGFAAGEVEELFGRAAAKAGLTDPDEAPPVPAEPLARLGDVWLLGRHRLACGDCTIASVVEIAVAGANPRLMVTDPPYGVNYDPMWRADAGVNKNTAKMGLVLNDDRADWREAWALFKGDVVYVWHAGLFAGVVADSLKACDFALRSQIMWNKERFALSRSDYHWQHEPCWYAVRKGAAGHFEGGRSQSTRWDINAREGGGLGHGTQKPLECMRRPIENNSRAGDAVYEPFSGSGTTIIAAEMTGRRCLAIELNPAYIDVAVQRWQDFTGESATLEGDGRTFAEVAASGERGAAL